MAMLVTTEKNVATTRVFPTSKSLPVTEQNLTLKFKFKKEQTDSVQRKKNYFSTFRFQLGRDFSGNAFTPRCFLFENSNSWLKNYFKVLSRQPH